MYMCDIMDFLDCVTLIDRIDIQKRATKIHVRHI